MATMEQSEKVIDVEMKENEGKSASPTKRKSEASDSTMESPVKKQLKPSSPEAMDMEKEAKEAEEALLRDDEESKEGVEGPPPADIIKAAEVEEAKAAAEVNGKDKEEKKANVEEVGSSDDVDTEPEQNGNEKVAEDAPKETVDAVEPEASK